MKIWPILSYSKLKSPAELALSGDLQQTAGSPVSVKMTTIKVASRAISIKNQYRVEMVLLFSI